VRKNAILIVQNQIMIPVDVNLIFRRMKSLRYIFFISSLIISMYGDVECKRVSIHNSTLNIPPERFKIIRGGGDYEGVFNKARSICNIIDNRVEISFEIVEKKEETLSLRYTMKNISKSSIYIPNLLASQCDIKPFFIRVRAKDKKDLIVRDSIEGCLYINPYEEHFILLKPMESYEAEVTFERIGEIDECTYLFVEPFDEWDVEDVTVIFCISEEEVQKIKRKYNYDIWRGTTFTYKPQKRDK
jgi:hypothetical protein